MMKHQLAALNVLRPKIAAKKDEFHTVVNDSDNKMETEEAQTSEVAEVAEAVQEV
jgi:hypothetical protein